MREAILLAAVLLAGCAGAGEPDPATATSSTSTDILLVDDVLLSPGGTRAAFAFKIPGGGASSGAIELQLAGSFTGISIEGPASCEIPDEIGIPPPGGSVGYGLQCGEIPAGPGEIVVAIASGTAQGRIAFAVGYSEGGSS